MWPVCRRLSGRESRRMVTRPRREGGHTWTSSRRSLRTSSLRGTRHSSQNLISRFVARSSALLLRERWFDAVLLASGFGGRRRRSVAVPRFRVDSGARRAAAVLAVLERRASPARGFSVERLQAWRCLHRRSEAVISSDGYADFARSTFTFRTTISSTRWAGRTPSPASTSSSPTVPSPIGRRRVHSRPIPTSSSSRKHKRCGNYRAR